MIVKSSKCLLFLLFSMAMAGALLQTAFAQPATTTQYVYDNNGRLRAVVSPTGEANVYEYDPAGNITAIRRLLSTAFEVIAFTPQAGAIGTKVTFFGVGIMPRAGGGAPSVSFNGVSATSVNYVSTTILEAVVPVGATTGPIMIVTGRGTATTAPFTVRGLGVIPRNVTVASFDRVKFTASVMNESGDQSVFWRVNNTFGGNALVGNISPEGLYNAPTLPADRASASFIVKAASASDSDLSGTAQVTVKNLNRIYTPISPGVSVFLTPTFASLPKPTAPFNAVMVTTGPVIRSISPATLVRGTATLVTIDGDNLAGVTGVFLSPTSNPSDSAIMVTELFATAGRVTARITAGTAIPARQRILIVATGSVSSTGFNTGVNAIQIQ